MTAKPAAAAPAYQPAGVSPPRRARARFAVRLWSIRNARFFEFFYNRFAAALLGLHPVLKRIGYQRLEGPTIVFEKAVKGLLFDCRMCGRCVLSSTGMSCPMNCPKALRNGPCGGVRANGNCEVEPDMPCVWVQAWQGSRRMKDGDKILDVQKPVEQNIQGSSAWLRVTSESALAQDAEAKAEAGEAQKP
ncbi:MAG: methylenetetrahydrofolate reductase C-terminal domain-containing protein [Rhodospirillales bacterium]